MPQPNETILLDVKISNAQAVQNIAALKEKVAELKQEQQAYIDAQNEEDKVAAKNSETYVRLNEQIKALNVQISEQSRIVQAEAKEARNLEGSYNALSAQLAQLKSQYKAVATDEERKAITSRLKEVNDQLVELDKQQGVYVRNVGNYASVWNSLPGPLAKFGQAAGNAQKMSEGLTQAASKAPAMLQGMASGFGAATKAALKFIATPIGALLAAIVVAVKLLVAGFDKLKEAFEKNDKAGTSLSKLMASFKPIIEAVSAAFDKLAEGLGKVAEKLADWIGGVSDAAKSAQELVEAQDKLEESERQYTEKSAKRNMAIAKLRAEATEKDKYSLEERRKRLQLAIKLEKKNLEEDKRIKAEQLRILEETARRERDTSDETANKIAQARAAMYQAEQNYFTGVRSLQKQLNSFDSEEENEKKRQAQEAKQRAKEQAAEAKRQAQERKQRQKEQQQAAREYQDFRIQVRKETEDALLSIEKDATVKAVAQARLQGEREIEALRVKMSRLKKSDKQARDDIQKMIEAKEQETQDAIDAILLKAQVEREAKQRENARAQIEIETKDAQALMDLRIQNTEEDYKRLKALTDEQVTILYTTWDDYNAALIAADKARQDAIEARETAAYQRSQQRRENEFEKRRQAAKGDEIALAKIELDAAAEENQQLLDMDEDTKRRMFSSQEEYEAAMIASYKRIADASKQYAEVMTNTVVNMAQQALGTIDTILGAVEEQENDQMEQYMADNEAKKEALKDRLDSGLITQAEYDNQVIKIDEDSDKKKKELEMSQAKRQKAMAVMNATLNAAGAIIASLAQSPVAIGPIPNPAGIASLALATATGIAQIAAAAATPLPKASRGMLITGPSHAQGGTLIEAEGGEAIINKKATSRFLPILSRINQSTGGIPLYGSGGIVGDAQIEKAIASQQTADAISNTPIYVTVVDINEGQERMAKVVERKSY